MYSSVVLRHIFHFYDTWSSCAITYICDVTFSCTTSFCHFLSNIVSMCTMRIYRDARSFFIWHRKTWESLVSCTICTWSYTNKYNVGLHLYHNSMAATTLFRELNNRDTIAHNIANLVCGHLIFYNQVRYTAGKVTKNIFSHNMQPALSSLK